MVRNLRRIDGAEIAEAALVMPVVFIFLIGIIWFGRAFNIYSTITQAAQQGALVAARPVCATCTALTCSGGTTSTFPCDSTVTNAVFAVMQASSLDPTQILPNTTPPTGCTASSNVTICRNVQLNSSSTIQPPCASPPLQSQVCGTLVTLQFPFSFNLPFTALNLTQVTMTAQATSRMEN